MEPIHEDFHEADLFDDLSEDANEPRSEELECHDDAPAKEEDERADEPFQSSAKSSLTITALDAGAELPHDAAEGSGDHMTGFRAMAASMPTSTGHVRMGSSVPVSIPHMNRWKKADAAPDSPNTQYAPATFVPPHQLSQVNEFMFSFTGDSPSVAIKRDRLRARNAILKSTGFLEPGVEILNNIGLAERRSVAAGGLSQALQQQGSVAIPASAATAVETS